jgi:hypothetical protein
MNSSMIPGRLPEPPPAAKAFDLELLDGERLVGWIAPDRIGFVGFGTEIEAAYAAHVAHRAVANRIAQRDGRRPVPVELDHLTIRRDDGQARVHASGQPIATLLHPGDDARAGDSFAFELKLDGARDELAVRAKAHLAYRTMRRSGIRWSLWRVPAPAPLPPPAPDVIRANSANSDDMRIEAPIPRKYAAATAASFLMLVLGLFAPAALAAAIGAVALAALTIMRLTVLHARWPARHIAATHALPRSLL